jgi:hypothetical protein
MNNIRVVVKIGGDYFQIMEVSNMEKRLIKKLENSRGTGYGYRADRKAQHKKFRRAISDQLIREGLIEIDTRMDRLF